VSADAEATRYLLYTSGSTAAPKGVRHSDRTLGAECAAQAAYHRLTADEVFVMPSPVGHISGLLYGILLPIHLGATSVLMAEWDPGRFLSLVESERGTFCGGATPFLQGVVDHPDLARYNVSSLRLFPCGGADVPPDLIRRRFRKLLELVGRLLLEVRSGPRALILGTLCHCRVLAKLKLIQRVNARGAHWFIPAAAVSPPRTSVTVRAMGRARAMREFERIN
jgi:acyl-CoA synthetase (AMP-forming)/AMP-acid ligase II